MSQARNAFSLRAAKARLWSRAATAPMKKSSISSVAGNIAQVSGARTSLPEEAAVFADQGCEMTQPD